MHIPHWLDFLFPPRMDEIVLRSVSIDTFLAFALPHLVPVTRPGTIVLLPFNKASVRSAVHEAKYHGSEHAFTLLAGVLNAYLHRNDFMSTTRTGLVVLIPVPLGEKRRKERGFNQIEEITRRAVEGLNIVIDTTLLERIRDTTSQISLPRHTREENMRGAFRATCRIDPANTYMIIDDVVTTGATLQAAIEALREAGAKHIIPLALAH